ncbi:MAG: hypothetical protein HY810_07540 [Candidatus Omnitrophica bacterium]|nr:hypothetical protein [Candidatus Omnitrophota bacterium]
MIKEGYNMLQILLGAGVLSALIAGLISFRLQNNFFKEQTKCLQEKEEQDNFKKAEFIKKAFLHESNYNILLAEKANAMQQRIEQYFDTQCYSLFKENIALLGDELAESINNLYIELFSANSQIKKLNYTQVNYLSIKPVYENQKEKLEKFVTFLKTKLK